MGRLSKKEKVFTRLGKVVCGLRFVVCGYCRSWNYSPFITL
jgi:hypothetical protein